MDLLCKTLFAIFSTAISVTDIKTGVIPRLAFIVAFLIFALIKILFIDNFSILYSVSGLFLGLIIFLFAYFLSGKNLGLADVWYSALIGFLLGPLWWHVAIGLACIIGIAFIIGTNKKRIPFIPLMATGAISASVGKGWF